MIRPLIIDIPMPETLMQILWFGVGLTFGRGFGKRVDQDVKNSEWYSRQGTLTRNLVARLLDCFHHWFIGLGLVVYATGINSNHHEALTWFGYGLFVDDLPDLPSRIKGYFKAPAKVS